MKRHHLIIMSLALTSTALAGSASHQVDEDGDGFPVALSDLNGDSSVDHADIGIAEDAYDCDDSNAFVHPGSTEWIDGTDHDCDDLTPEGLPLDEEARNRFASAEYGGSLDLSMFAIEHKRCDAHAGCTVNSAAGTFDAADEYVFVDTYIGDTNVLGRDGYREVRKEGDDLTNDLNELSSRAPRVVGMSRSAVEELIATRDDAIAANAQVNDAQDEQIDGLKTDVKLVSSRQNTMEEAINATNRSVRTEMEARAAGDKSLLEGLGVVSDRQQDADERIVALEAEGVKVGVGGSLGWNGHVPLLTTVDDEVQEYLRGTGTFAGGVDFNVGADVGGSYGGLFGTLGLGYDSVGSGADRAMLFGGEILTSSDNTPAFSYGGFAAYRLTEAHDTSIDASVRGDGVCGGLALTVEPQGESAIAVEPFARLGLCHEWYGTRGAEDGEEFVHDSSGSAPMAQGGLRFTLSTAR